MNTWPKRLRSKAALDYLQQEHGIQYAPNTWRNIRWEGRGPRCEYLGSTPYVSPAELDRWVEATLTDRAANSRRARELAQSEQPQAAA